MQATTTGTVRLLLLLLLLLVFGICAKLFGSVKVVTNRIFDFEVFTFDTRRCARLSGGWDLLAQLTRPAARRVGRSVLLGKRELGHTFWHAHDTHHEHCGRACSPGNSLAVRDTVCLSAITTGRPEVVAASASASHNGTCQSLHCTMHCMSLDSHCAKLLRPIRVNSSFDSSTRRSLFNTRAMFHTSQ